jgi:glycine/D-amino acid oxidase-like deaminating enzyme
VSRRPDAVVVGAGIVGAACAVALARAGLRVVVVDSQFAGGGATAAAMGHLVVMDDGEAQFALTAYSLRLWTELAVELPADCEDDPCGTLWLAAEEAEMARVRAKADDYRARGVAAEVLDARQLAAAEPRLRRGLAGALLVPGDRVVYPPNAARFLLARAADHGAELRQGFPVSRIAGGAVEGPGERIAAPLVINAAGAAAPALTPGLPIVPRRGHLLITDRYPGLCRHQLIELGYLDSAHGRHAAGVAESVAFNVQPRATGQLLIGSSRELVGWDHAVNHRLERRMIGRALDFLPCLEGVDALRGWIGFRPATPDNLPLIGPWPEVPGLWIAAGHEGLGITTSLATAQLIADLVIGRQPGIDAAPYAPSRVNSHPSAARATPGSRDARSGSASGGAGEWNDGGIGEGGHGDARGAAGLRAP